MVKVEKQYHLKRVSFGSLKRKITASTQLKWVRGTFRNKTEKIKILCCFENIFKETTYLQNPWKKIERLVKTLILFISHIVYGQSP